MNARTPVLITSLAFVVLTPNLLHAAPAPPYRGVCEASAAAALDASHFVVANDEDNTLRVYRLGHAEVIDSIPLAEFLGTEHNKGSDTEGAARIRDQIYWITSHGTNKDGEWRPNRHRFFATEVQAGKPPMVKQFGRPYEDLLRDMVEEPGLKRYGLQDAARRKPEAKGGLNIEGLAATSDERLLIGLRNPLAGHRAIVIPLENPAEVISGKRARFGAAIELDLSNNGVGRGVRSIELIDGRYFIVAGPTDKEGGFALYQWSGNREDRPTPVAGVAFGDLHPEALIEMPGSRQMLLISDDGGKRCDKLSNGFRTITVLY